MLVLGSGQSALESGALLHEGGAEVEIVARARRIHWLQGWLSKRLHHRSGTLIRNLLYAPTDVGPAGLSQLMARPDLLNHLPRGLRDKLWKRSVRPAGAGWLVNRLRNVPIRLGRSVVSVAPVGEQLKVRLDGTTSSLQNLCNQFAALAVTLALRKGSNHRRRVCTFSVPQRLGASARCCNLCPAHITLRAPWPASLPERVRHK